MLVCDNLTLFFGSRVLLDQIQWQVRPGEKVALIGVNGSGKTTLLKVLAEVQSVDHGKIHKPNQMKVGYLPQDGLSFSGQTLFAEVRSVLADLIAIQDEIDLIESRLGKLAEEEQEAVFLRYDDLNEEFRLRDGYKMDARVGGILEGLGFPPSDWEKPCENFSGGWQMRIALAKILLQNPDLLLLDEPTNHLDIQARLWLQGYLKSLSSSIVLVSHDRFFLDQVINRCVEIYQGKLSIYDGNYSYFEVERERRYETLMDAKKKQDEEIKKVEDFIDRFRAKASKASQVQSRVKQLEKIERIVVPPLPPKSMRFQFPPTQRSGKIALQLQGITKAYGENVILKDINFQLERNEVVALVGVNGAGKSTMMKVLSNTETFEGFREEGHQVSIGYFAQEQGKEIDEKQTVLQALEEVTPFDQQPRVRFILGAFLFQGDDVTKKVSVLSGGERNRLALARLLVRPCNVLLLDEPTNHLDIQAKDVLLQALRNYDGTIIMVSHDRYFINQLATRVVEVKNQAIESFPGNFEEYVDAKASQGESAVRNMTWSTAARDVKAVQEEETYQKTTSVETTESKGANYFEEQQKKRETDKLTRKFKKAIEEIEAKLAKKEEQLQSFEVKMAVPSFYDDTENAQKVVTEYEQVKKSIEKLYQEWEKLSEELQIAKDKIHA